MTNTELAALIYFVDFLFKLVIVSTSTDTSMYTGKITSQEQLARRILVYTIPFGYLFFYLIDLVKWIIKLDK